MPMQQDVDSVRDVYEMPPRSMHQALWGAFSDLIRRFVSTRAIFGAPHESETNNLERSLADEYLPDGPYEMPSQTMSGALKEAFVRLVRKELRFSVSCLVSPAVVEKPDAGESAKPMPGLVRII